MRYYNDSKATTPESSIAAVTAFQAPVILIAGGYDKRSSFEFAGECANTRPSFLSERQQENKRTHPEEKGFWETPSIFMPKTFEEAFRQANALAEQEMLYCFHLPVPDTTFLNYEERGRQFKDMVKTL